jgi:hypothetical protein
MTDLGLKNGAGRNLLCVFEFPPSDIEWQMRDLAGQLQTQSPGIRVRFCAGFLRAYRPGGLTLSRLLNGAWVHGRAFGQILCGSYDAVLVRSAPPLIQLTVAVACGLRRIRFWVWLMDAHPEIEQVLWRERAALSAVLEGLNRLNRRFLRRAEIVIVLDEAMRRRLVPDRAESRMIVCPTWGRELPPLVADEDRGVDGGPEVLRLLYLGNLGFAHDLAALRRLLEVCVKRAPVELTFIGTPKSAIARIRDQSPGSRLKINELPHVPFVRLATLLRTLTLDYGLVALQERFAGLVSPSKFIGYLIGGVPVLYLGPPETNTAVACDHCGAGLRVDSALLAPENESRLIGRVFDLKSQAERRLAIPAAIAHFHAYDATFLAAQILERTGGGPGEK